MSLIVLTSSLKSLAQIASTSKFAEPRRRRRPRQSAFGGRIVRNFNGNFLRENFPRFAADKRLNFKTFAGFDFGSVERYAFERAGFAAVNRS
jgi:hypothetical protein